MFSIQSATESDIEMLSALACFCFADNFAHLYTAEPLKNHLEKTCSPNYFAKDLQINTTLLLKDNDKFAGYAKFGNLEIPAPSPIIGAQELHRFYLRPEYQGTGIAQQLMEAALSHPILFESPTIYLGVWSQNIRAQRFYARYGFQKIGEYDYIVGEHVDNEWIMARKAQCTN